MVDRARQQVRKMDYAVGIGDVREVEKLRDRYGFPNVGEGKACMEMYDAIESSGDVIDGHGSLGIIFDGQYDDFRSMVEEVSKMMSDTAENKVSQLSIIADTLSAMKSDGIIGDLYKDEYISKEERNALSSYENLDDIAQDLITLSSMTMLQNRLCSDLSASLHSVRRAFDDAQYKYRHVDNPVINKLQKLGIVEYVEDAKYIGGRQNPPENRGNVRLSGGDGQAYDDYDYNDGYNNQRGGRQPQQSRRGLGSGVNARRGQQGVDSRRLGRGNTRPRRNMDAIINRPYQQEDRGHRDDRYGQRDEKPLSFRERQQLRQQEEYGYDSSQRGGYGDDYGRGGYDDSGQTYYFYPNDDGQNDRGRSEDDGGIHINMDHAFAN